MTGTDKILSAEKAAWCLPYSAAGTGTDDVGKRIPDKHGIYDLHGNVYEWCEERKNDDTRKSFKQTAMGGSYLNTPSQCGCSEKLTYKCAPDEIRSSLIGFRVICEK